MSRFRALRAGLHRVFRSREAERDLDDEVGSFLEMAVEERVRGGMSRDDALRTTRIELGGVSNVKETVRRGGWENIVGTSLRDLRFALRQVRQAPAIATTSVLILAIGIGVNSALLSFIDREMHPVFPGVGDPDRVVQIRAYLREVDHRYIRVDEYFDFRARQDVFEDVAAVPVVASVIVDAGDKPTPHDAILVTGSFFSVTRARMAVGAPFSFPDGPAAIPEAIAVVSHGFWMNKLGGDSSAIGRSIRINRVPHRVVGVLARGFRTPGIRPDIWVPFPNRTLLFPRRQGTTPRVPIAYVVYGRLRRGMSLEQAGVASTAAFSAIGGTHSPDRPLATATLRSFTAPRGLGGVLLENSPLAILGAIVLAIACANVSILLLGRAATRRREIAVRLSLGAARGRVIRQLLTESILLAATASSVGLLLLSWVDSVIRTMYPSIERGIPPNWRTVAITLIIGSITGILCGLLPALHATRASLSDVLKDAAPGFDRRRTRVQRRLVVAEVALSMALVSGAGLAVLTFLSVANAERGYEISPRVLVAAAEVRDQSYSPARTEQFIDDALARLRAIPGVERVSATNIAAAGNATSAMAGPAWIRYIDPVLGARSTVGTFGRVDSGYFAAMGTALLRGRDVLPTDRAGTQPVAVITKSLADLLWPGAEAIGRSLSFAVGYDSASAAANGKTYIVNVIGVVETVHPLVPHMEGDSNGPPPVTIYRPRHQLADSGGTTFVVRVSHDAEGVSPKVEVALRGLDRNLIVEPVRSTERLATEEFEAGRRASFAGTMLGLIALAIACVGLYAVVAFGVQQRTREIGIRIAVGASAGEVVRLFFRDGVKLALIGFVIGVPITFIAMRLLVWSLFGAIPFPVSAIFLIMAVLLGVSAAASWLPARRAAHVDPVDALRSE